MKVNSFARSVKDELTLNEYSDESNKIALLSGFIRNNGVMVIRNKTYLLTLNSENPKIVRFIYKLLGEQKLVKAKLESYSRGKSTKRVNYKIELSGEVELFLENIGVSFLEGKISKDIVFDDETIKHYLIGVFLATGSVNSPKTSNYHLELALNNENYMKWLLHLFPRYKGVNIEPKTIQRRDKYVIYLKRSDQIADFLMMLGAVENVMEFENVRINRDYINNTNRLTNLDTANMEKTINSSKRQVKEFKYLINKHTIEQLGNEKVQLAINLKMEFLSASLEEIAGMMSEKLNIIVTKSNVNHIYRKLHERYIKEYDI